MIRGATANYPVENRHFFKGQTKGVNCPLPHSRGMRCAVCIYSRWPEGYAGQLVVVLRELNVRQRCEEDGIEGRCGWYVCETVRSVKGWVWVWRRREALPAARLAQSGVLMLVRCWDVEDTLVGRGSSLHGATTDALHQGVPKVPNGKVQWNLDLSQGWTVSSHLFFNGVG